MNLELMERLRKSAEALDLRNRSFEPEAFEPTYNERGRFRCANPKCDGIVTIAQGGTLCKGCETYERYFGREVRNKRK